jgi:proline iminopeptidase
MPQPETAGFIELYGTRVSYNVAGEEHEETIVVLHGGRGIGDHRAEFGPYRALADRYRVLAFDKRGCGRLSAAPPYAFERGPCVCALEVTCQRRSAEVRVR